MPTTHHCVCIIITFIAWIVKHNIRAGYWYKRQ